MARLKIGVDVDGVLANFFSAYEELIIKESGEDRFGVHRYPAEIPCTWNWPQHYGYSEAVIKKVWGRIRDGEDFWYNLSWLPGSESFLYALNYTPHDVYFISDRAGIRAQAQTALWLDEGYFDLPAVIISKNKGAVCKALEIDFYVDDKGENIVDVEFESPSTKAFLLNRPYNQHVYVRRRIQSLKEFEAAINGN